MSRQTAQAVTSISLALRSAMLQACGGWTLRPLGSLITPQPSTSTSFRAPSSASQVRSMSRLPGSFSSLMPSSWFDYRKMVYPDVYDPNDALLCNRYKTHGSVIERYDPPVPFHHWNPLLDPELERRTKYLHKRLHTSFLLYRSVWGYRKPLLQARILDTYRVVNTALATGDMRLAERFVTEQMLQRLSGEVARRGRNYVEWQMVGEPDPTEAVTLVAGAEANNPMKHGKLRFVQWTARIASKQVVAVYDARGKLLAGDPNKELDVVDFWVFERPILKSLMVPRPGPQGAEWRLIERLSI